MAEYLSVETPVFNMTTDLTNILIVDTETTGLDPEKDSICEVGAILFNVKHRAVVSQLSFLLPVEENAACAINKIPAELTGVGMNDKDSFAELFADMSFRADAIVAHNADFDRQWLRRDWLGSVNWKGSAVHLVFEKHWICTCHGITWEGLRPSPSLAALALHYGVPVWAAHRALTDCTYLAQIFERDDTLEFHLAEGLLPLKRCAAIVSYDDRELAKEAGFRWDPAHKLWIRSCNDFQISQLQFKVRILSHA